MDSGSILTEFDIGSRIGVENIVFFKLNYEYVCKLHALHTKIKKEILYSTEI